MERTRTAMSEKKMETTPQDEEELCCPICLSEINDDITFLGGKCQHHFCEACIQRVLAVAPSSTSSSSSNNRYGRETSSVAFPNAEDLLNHCPTVGRCPICRATINRFELKKCGEDESFYKGNSDLLNCPLKGKTYIKYRCIQGNESIHFPDKALEQDGGQEHVRPYLRLDKVPKHDPFFRFDDGSSLPDTVYFDEGSFFFDDHTRTFVGSISWNKGECCGRRFRGSPRWDFILSFSSDFRFISRGVIIAKRIVCRKEDCNSFRCKFPFDGQWKVELSQSTDGQCDDESNGTAPVRTVRVLGNQFVFEDSFVDSTSNGPHRIELNDPHHPIIAWRDNTETIAVRRGVNLISHPYGPRDGETIEFERSLSSEHSNMTWTRLSRLADTDDILQIYQFSVDGDGTNLSYELYDGSNYNEEFSLPEYHSDTIWGNTFGQGLSVGLASYHFLQDETMGAYISYEHERTAQWPPLDNGMPVPSKVWFRDVDFDAEARIFRGKIDWEGDHATSWQGNRYWLYEMHFAEGFTCITSGSVKSVSHGSEQAIDMSIFAEELVYINIGLLEKYRKDTESTESYQRNLATLSTEVFAQMQRAEASMRSLAMLQYVWSEAAQSAISYPRSFRRDEN